MSSPRLLSNRYEIGETLGYGGMSEVHRGRDTRLGRDVAVKILRADLARDPTFQLRFRREAQNAAALNHPAIVAVYDTGETESENGPLPYIVMEYVDGRTLRDIVKTEGPLPPRRAMEVMADASAALDFSHRHGIVHRDVKPANIMITTSGAVKVMDFGIARALDGQQAAVTQTAAVIGTAQYLSPEQARGESVDARSDVYAAGCVLFELLTGEPPFTGDSPVAVAYQHVREEPRKPSDVNPTVPASLDAVVLKALSKNPANRYQSASEMRADLVRVLSGQRPKAPMIMSDEERTAMLEETSSTEMVQTGRHHRVEPEEDGEETAYEQAPARGGKRRKNLLIALVTVACVAVFALAAWLTTFLMAQQEPEQIRVPNLRGRVQADAVAFANSNGWNPVIVQCPSNQEQVNRVVNQEPEANTLVPENQRQLKLCIGTGPEQTQVPDLYGLSIQEAWEQLNKAGLSLGSIEYQETENEQLVDKIIEWSNRDSTIDKGTAIDVVIGKKSENVQIPDLRGQPFETAEAFLVGAGFKVQKQEVDSDQPGGTVVNQDPAPGSKARPGTTVTLMVSKGEQLTMPDLREMSPEEALEELRDMGWSGELRPVSRSTSDSDEEGKVIGSDPSPGQSLGKNQPVTIYVGEDEDSPSTTPGGGIFPPFG